MRGTRCANLLLAIAATAFVLICSIVSGCSGRSIQAARAQSANSQQATVTSRQQADLIHQGKLIFDETPKYASSYVGNKLACNDCHLQTGTAAYAAPMIDLAGLFPMFNKRAGHVISLQTRIQECFTRSEAGRPLPEDSREMQAMVGYINWLSKDGAKGKVYRGRGL